MKKFLLTWMFIFLLSFGENVSATQYYIPQRNTWYTRSQHTYSFRTDTEYHNEYAPSVFTLLADNAQVKSPTKVENLWDVMSIWNFQDYYALPWNTEMQDYNIGLCIDLLISIQEGVPYNKVLLADSTYIKEDIKNQVAAIVLNAYPFITVEKMKQQLIDAGVLEYAEVTIEEEVYDETLDDYVTRTRKETILRAKGNTKAFKSITTDELLTATQMAIYHYSDPGLIEDIYYDTVHLSGRTVLREAEPYESYWKNEYESNRRYCSDEEQQLDCEYIDPDTHEAIDNNIRAVYDYWIEFADKATAMESPKFTKITQAAVHKGNDVSVYFDKEIDTSKTGLILSVVDKNGSTTDYEVKNLKQQNGAFIIPNVKNYDEKKIQLTGKDYVENQVWIYEAEGGKDKSQTIIGVSSDLIPIETSSPVSIVYVPNTSDSVNNSILLFSFSMILLFGTLVVHKKLCH